MDFERFLSSSPLHSIKRLMSSLGRCFSCLYQTYHPSYAVVVFYRFLSTVERREIIRSYIHEVVLKIVQILGCHQRFNHVVIAWIHPHNSSAPRRKRPLVEISWQRQIVKGAIMIFSFIYTAILQLWRYTHCDSVHVSFNVSPKIAP